METNQKEETLNTILSAIEWHSLLEKEFRNPCLPHDLTPELCRIKLEEIENQRERHEKWVKALKLLLEKLKKSKV